MSGRSPRVLEGLQVNRVNACFVISKNRGRHRIDFPQFPQGRVTVAPKGINVEMFKPREKTFDQVLKDVTGVIVWPTALAEADLAKCKRAVTFASKAAEWKRQAGLLEAAAQYKKEFPDPMTMCVGVGPEEEVHKLKAKCESLA